MVAQIAFINPTRISEVSRSWQPPPPYLPLDPAPTAHLSQSTIKKSPGDRRRWTEN